MIILLITMTIKDFAVDRTTKLLKEANVAFVGKIPIRCLLIRFDNFINFIHQAILGLQVQKNTKPQEDNMLMASLQIPIKLAKKSL